MSIDHDRHEGVPKTGARIELVRWIRGSDGLVPTVVTGTYLGVEDDVWVIRHPDNSECRYPRADWIRCQP
ncbi:hypothetical protein [Leifsonia sp. NPDC058248]|uniref:hypothetical protein n=1 Tax=Leifsonia sp. NPDC058248 TaxID=3346402 RepID=UPI0036D861F3